MKDDNVIDDASCRDTLSVNDNDNENDDNKNDDSSVDGNDNDDIEINDSNVISNHYSRHKEANMNP